MLDKKRINEINSKARDDITRLAGEGLWVEAALSAIDVINDLYGNLDEERKIYTARKYVEELRCLSCDLKRTDPAKQ